MSGFFREDDDNTLLLPTELMTHQNSQPNADDKPKQRKSFLIRLATLSQQKSSVDPAAGCNKF